jgi:hypothetical protein
MIAWAILGFDSGIGMVQMLISTLPQLLGGSITFTAWIQNTYQLYGITGHFSAVVTYCLMFCGLSKFLEGLNIKGSKNLFISLNLVFLNGALFELFYQFSYAIFQTPIYLVKWITEFLGWYIVILIGGLYTLLYFWANSYEGSYRTYRFQPSKRLLIVIGIFVASMFLWWFYPFPFYHYGTSFFPQTVYSGPYYIANDGIHFVNILVKAMFAICQYFILAQFIPATHHAKRSRG